MKIPTYTLRQDAEVHLRPYSCMYLLIIRTKRRGLGARCLRAKGRREAGRSGVDVVVWEVQQLRGCGRSTVRAFSNNISQIYREKGEKCARKHYDASHPAPLPAHQPLRHIASQPPNTTARQPFRQPPTHPPTRTINQPPSHTATHSRHSQPATQH